MRRLLPATAASLLVATLSLSFAETIVLPGSDETIPSPEIVSIGPYVGSEGAGEEPLSFLAISFLAVPEAIAYRIYLEMDVHARLDSTGTLVPTAASELQFVQWGSVDAVHNSSVYHVVIASLESTATRYGVATEVIRDGEVRLSPLSVAVHAGASTAIPTISWGVVKRLRERLPR